MEDQNEIPLDVQVEQRIFGGDVIQARNRLRESLRELLAFAEEHVGLSYRDADVPIVMDDPVLKNARAALAAADDGQEGS